MRRLLVDATCGPDRLPLLHVHLWSIHHATILDTYMYCRCGTRRIARNDSHIPYVAQDYAWLIRSSLETRP